MKFKVKDKVVNRLGFKGTVQEVFKNGCFVNYGDYADFEYFADLIRPKRLPTLEQADKSAKQEKEAEIMAQNFTKLYCEYLGKLK